MNRQEFLANMMTARLFRGLSIENMDEIMSLAEVKFFPSGKTVIEENSPGDKFYWIESGRLEVHISQSNNSGKILIQNMKPGDLFGEMALLGVERRTASVIAKS